MKLIPHRLAAGPWYTGIRSLVRKGSRVGPLADSVALPPVPTNPTLTLTDLLLQPLTGSGAGRFRRPLRVATQHGQVGRVDDWLRDRPFVIGAGHAFTRRMMQAFGPLDPAVHHEDQIMVFRALALGGAVTVDAALVRYRRGGASATPVRRSRAQVQAWRIRRLRQEIAEREQLERDAAVAGCTDAVAAAFEPLRVRQDYLQRLYDADSARGRLQARRHRGRKHRQPQLDTRLETTFPIAAFGEASLRYFEGLSERVERDGSIGRQLL